MSEKDTGTPRTDGNGKAKTLTKAERARRAEGESEGDQPSGLGERTCATCFFQGCENYDAPCCECAVKDGVYSMWRKKLPEVSRRRPNAGIERPKKPQEGRLT